MPRLSLLSALGAAVLLTSPLATAMGFGPTSTQTTLGQRLDFSASVLLDADETIQRGCVFADVFAGDAKVAAPNVRVTLEATRDNTQRIVRVTTATVIDEPIVTVEVTLGCGSRVSRRFVTFIDPPSLQLAEAGASETVPLPSQRIDSQIASLADIARQADASRRRGRNGEAAPNEDDRPPRTTRRQPRAQRIAVAAAAQAAPTKSRRRHAAAKLPSPVSRTALAGSPGTGGPRLRLEPPRLLAASPAVAASAAGVAPPLAIPPLASPAIALAQAAAALPVSEAASDTLQRERERIQVLEAGLASVRSDSQATQQTVVALQARLRQAEGERYWNGLVYALIGTTVLAILVAAALWWLRPRQRRRARWFDAQASQQAKAERSGQRPTAARGAPAAPTAAAPASALSEPPSLWRDGPASVLQVTTPAAIGGLEVTTVLGPEFSRPVAEHPMLGGAGSPYKNGELSMEELIDLEQQAEFFVVLGQDEAAISLLEGYMQGAGGKSPLPYLQLLEIQQRRGDQLAYDRVRKSFNDRFHALAPDWSSDLHFGRALDGYPQTIARLQSLWTTPLSAMQALDNLLFRRQSSDDTFDFPAYRELLFLYSIARELSGNVETDFGSIDLFLPLEGTAGDAQHEQPDTSNLAVDLDVSNWPEDATMSDLLVHRSRGRRGAA